MYLEVQNADKKSCQIFSSSLVLQMLRLKCSGHNAHNDYCTHLSGLEPNSIFSLSFISANLRFYNLLFATVHFPLLGRINLTIHGYSKIYSVLFRYILLIEINFSLLLMREIFRNDGEEMNFLLIQET